MRRQYIFVTIWLIFYASEVFSADIAWACQRAPEDKIIWSCVADRSQSVEPKAVFKDPAVSLEEPLLATDSGETGQDYLPASKPSARSVALSVWLDNIPRQNHLIQFGAFQSLANATLLLEDSPLSQELRIVPVRSRGMVTYIVLSDISFMRKEGIAVAKSFFYNDTEVNFWLRTPQSLAKLVSLD